MEACFSRPLVQDGLTHIHRLASWEELRRRGFSWDDLVTLLRTYHVVWLSRDVFVYYYDDESNSVNQTLLNRGDHTCFFVLFVEKNETDPDEPPMDGILICSVTPDEEPAREYQELFQLIGRKPKAEVAVSYGDDSFDVEVEGADGRPARLSRLPVSPETLACLLDNSSQRWLSLENLYFSEQQCQRLASFKGSLGIENCSLADDGRAVCEAVEMGCGPVHLEIDSMRIDESSLTKAVQGTTSLRSLRILKVPGLLRRCLPALEHNRSLLYLVVRPDVADHFTDKEWSDMFRAIEKHETLECLKFVDKGSSDLEDTDAARVTRAEVILETARSSRALYEIELEPTNLVDRQIFDEQIQPCLTANLYRGRVKEIVEEPDGCDQRQLFSRALTQTEVNRNPSAMYLLLSGFHDLLSEMYRASEAQDEDRTPAFGTRSRKKRPRSQFST